MSSRKRQKPKSLPSKHAALTSSVPILDLWLKSWWRKFKSIFNWARKTTQKTICFCSECIFIDHITVLNFWVAHASEKKFRQKTTDQWVQIVSEAHVWWSPEMPLCMFQSHHIASRWNIIVTMTLLQASREPRWSLLCCEPMLLCLLHSPSDGWCQQTSPVINRAGHWGTAQVVFLLYSP